ncbi:hypothetical protein CEXT_657991 [Caerostris extrusa]|uniref:Uncharacterized protein n=1 Tax=Caerostris extrusa TaxID=172846 RepID=A0AAV4NJJ4_CAEEX|nr:hypothetical protein CEXT_657991 [Caerostris extrusa]
MLSQIGVIFGYPLTVAIYRVYLRYDTLHWLERGGNGTVPDQVFCSFWTSNRTKGNILFNHPITNNITNDTLIEEVVATKVEAVTIETIST